MNTRLFLQVVPLVALAFLTDLGECKSKSILVKLADSIIPSRRMSCSTSGGPRCRLKIMGSSYHVGDISVGTPPQKIKVLFDTGSTILWLASRTISNPMYHKTHKTYDYNKSSTFDKNFVSRECELEYFDIDIKGVTVKDDITVGNMKVKGQVFMAATDVGHLKDHDAGIFGLGFSRGPYKPGSMSPFENMIANNVVDHPVFAFYFDKRNKMSELILGAIESKHFVRPLTYKPVVDNNCWAVSIDKIMVDGKVIARNHATIVDSGASHNIGPVKLIDSIHRTVGASDQEGMVYPNCSKMNSFPTVTFVIDNIEFPLTPQDYILKKKGRCESGFASSDRLDNMMLGYVWMKKYYTVFDMGRYPRIGFALAKP